MSWTSGEGCVAADHSQAGPQVLNVIYVFVFLLPLSFSSKVASLLQQSWHNICETMSLEHFQLMLWTLSARMDSEAVSHVRQAERRGRSY